MTKPNSITPSLAAQQFAKNNPNFTGVLVVSSCTPAGRGGWKITSKATTFYLRNGALAPKRETAKRDFRNSTWNGVCPVCGQVIIDCTICWRKAHDGLTVRACPTCAESLNLAKLAPTDWVSFPYSRLEQIEFVHPKADALIDIRNLQMQLDDAQPSITFFKQPMSISYPLSAVNDPLGS